MTAEQRSYRDLRIDLMRTRYWSTRTDLIHTPIELHGVHQIADRAQLTPSCWAMARAPSPSSCCDNMGVSWPCTDRLPAALATKVASQRWDTAAPDKGLRCAILPRDAEQFHSDDDMNSAKAKIRDWRASTRSSFRKCSRSTAGLRRASPHNDALSGMGRAHAASTAPSCSAIDATQSTPSIDPARRTR